jgi:tRNA threonylcarbamoyladenosine biosynthesis protein TsaE
MSMNTSIRINGLAELPEIAGKILSFVGKRRVIAFFGEMGAGKTTLIKAICKKLEVVDATSSPSFGLINEYRTRGGTAVYHFDFYRIRTMEEAYDLGYEEYLYSGRYCFIEWPEMIESLLPEGTIRACISVMEDATRVVELDCMS